MPTPPLANAARVINWLRDEARDAKELLVPLSGGTDSSLCFFLCSQALEGRAVGVHFGDDLPHVEWLGAYGEILASPHPVAPPEHREAARWAALLLLAHEREAWLVGSRNRTEDVLGMYSVASRAATILPIVGLWKTEVLELCDALCMPPAMLEASLRADPECGRPQEFADIGYRAIDDALMYLVNEMTKEDRAAMPPPTAGAWQYLMSLRAANAYKHRLPVRGPTGKRR